MLPKEDNDLITHVGPGTAMGNLLRHYWLPAMMSAELPSPDCPPMRLRLLGENMIRHAKALRDGGATPPGVDQPELYKVRSVCAVLPDGVDGIAATHDQQFEAVPAEPMKLTT